MGWQWDLKDYLVRRVKASPILLSSIKSRDISRVI